MNIRYTGIWPIISGQSKKARTIWHASLPAQAVIPMLQHQGEQASALVRVGDEVREGLLIGRTEGPDGSGVHSPIPGVVENVAPVTLPDGQACSAVSIKLQGNFDYLGKQKQHHEWQDLSPLAIIDIAQDKGLVNMDGFGEPLAPMLKEYRKQGAGTIVVNAATGAPFISSELSLASEYSTELLEGIRVLSRVFSSSDVWLAYPRGSRRVLRPLLSQAQSMGVRLKAVSVPHRYASSDPWELLRMTGKRELRPHESGGVLQQAVFSLSTVYALYEAVVLRRALVDRLVTVGGGAMGATRTIRVRLGTSVSVLLAELGGLQKPAAKILMGSPLQAYEVSDPDTPVTKQVSAVIALTEEELNNSLQLPCLSYQAQADEAEHALEDRKVYKLMDEDRMDLAQQAELFISQDPDIRLKMNIPRGLVQDSPISPQKNKGASVRKSSANRVPAGTAEKAASAQKGSAPEQSTGDRAPFVFSRKLAVAALPHFATSLTSSWAMWFMTAVLSVLALWGTLLFGLRAAEIILLSLGSGLLSECIALMLLVPRARWARELQRSLGDGSTVLCCLLLGLTLPVTVHPLVPVLASVFAVLVVKWSFGGLGTNWLNPALAGNLFVQLSWPQGFHFYPYQGGIIPGIARLSEGPSWASDLEMVKMHLLQSGSPVMFRPLQFLGGGSSPLDEFFVRLLNEQLFIPLQTILPNGYIDYLFGLRLGAIGETSAILILLLSTVLLARGIISWEIPLAGGLAMGALSLVYSGSAWGAQLFTGDALFALLSGGFLFVLFFMASDPVTSPHTVFGKLLFGFGFGALTFLFREFSILADGSVPALLLMNALTPLIISLTRGKPIGVQRLFHAGRQA